MVVRDGNVNTVWESIFRLWVGTHSKATKTKWIHSSRSSDDSAECGLCEHHSERHWNLFLKKEKIVMLFKLFSFMVNEIAALNRGKKKTIQEITLKNYMFSKGQKMISSTLQITSSHFTRQISILYSPKCRRQIHVTCTCFRSYSL